MIIWLLFHNTFVKIANVTCSISSAGGNLWLRDSDNTRRSIGGQATCDDDLGQRLLSRLRAGARCCPPIGYATRIRLMQPPCSGYCSDGDRGCARESWRTRDHLVRYVTTVCRCLRCCR